MARPRFTAETQPEACYTARAAPQKTNFPEYPRSLTPAGALRKATAYAHAAAGLELSIGFGPPKGYS